jgi:hypothetical protein
MNLPVGKYEIRRPNICTVVYLNGKGKAFVYGTPILFVLLDVRSVKRFIR